MWSNIFEKGAKAMQCGKDSLFNRGCWENCISTSKRMKLEPYLPLCLKINSEWIKDINIRPGTIKLLEENREGELYDIEDMTPKSQATK